MSARANPAILHRMLNHHIHTAIANENSRALRATRPTRRRQASGVAKASAGRSLFGTSRPIRAMTAQKLGSSG